MFAMMIPIITNFQKEDNFIYSINVNIPCKTNCLSFSILPNALPSESGVYVEYSVEPYTTWDFLGIVTCSFPTQLWDAPWALNQNNFESTLLKMRLRVLPIDKLKILWEQNEKRKYEYKLNYAKRIANDLYNYFRSYEKPTIDNRTILELPSNVMDRWYDKFCHKLKFDSKFMK